MRVAVAMVMDNPGTAPRTVKDAALLVGKGQDVKQVKVWQLAPIPPEGSGLVMCGDGAAGSRGAGHLHPQVVRRERSSGLSPSAA